MDVMWELKSSIVFVLMFFFALARKLHSGSHGNDNSSVLQTSAEGNIYSKKQNEMSYLNGLTRINNIEMKMS